MATKPEDTTWEKLQMLPSKMVDNWIPALKAKLGIGQQPQQTAGGVQPPQTAANNPTIPPPVAAPMAPVAPPPAAPAPGITAPAAPTAAAPGPVKHFDNVAAQVGAPGTPTPALQAFPGYMRPQVAQPGSEPLQPPPPGAPAMNVVDDGGVKPLQAVPALAGSFKDWVNPPVGQAPGSEPLPQPGAGAPTIANADALPPKQQVATDLTNSAGRAGTLASDSWLNFYHGMSGNNYSNRAGKAITANVERDTAIAEQNQRLKDQLGVTRDVGMANAAAVGQGAQVKAQTAKDVAKERTNALTAQQRIIADRAEAQRMFTEGENEKKLKADAEKTDKTLTSKEGLALGAQDLAAQKLDLAQHADHRAAGAALAKTIKSLEMGPGLPMKGKEAQHAALVQQLVEHAKGGEQPAAPSASPAAAATRMTMPDGTVRMVPANRVDELSKLGAKAA